ncbi:MAG: hypothetical protein CTY38_01255 [Methylotenera sp.]|uniref:hypothetical protein n=1 Tax=Methylotenera sp. TaxID=2051956 RepID=UPI000D415BEE|nr:hypothetical protein [Methylotenera sp.]PPC84704.1 MAG: hypothetical protein CTY38_01255 [Methylotenera sp.]
MSYKPTGTHQKIDWMDMTFPPINLHNVPALNYSPKTQSNQESMDVNWGKELDVATGSKRQLRA